MSGPLAVIAAPLLWPVAAILQLLFPVLLREQVRAYRWAVVAVVGESSLLISHWLLSRFFPGRLSTDWLPWAVVAGLAACAVAAWWQARPPAGRPHRLEWASFGTLFLIFAA